MPLTPRPCRPRLLLAGGLLVALFVASGGLGAAWALGFERETPRIATSTDGKNHLCLLEERSPEGGRALGYFVVEGDDLAAEVRVSSTLSRGAGPGRESISPSACRAALRTLETALRRHSIVGVALHPERCDRKDRRAVVTVDSKP